MSQNNPGIVISAFNKVMAGIRAQLENKVDIGGSIESANKLATPFNVNVTGDVDGTGQTDGSADLNLNLTLDNTGVNPGTYPVVTVDAKGRATAGRALQPSDVPTLNQNTTGNAATSSKWNTPRDVTMSGDGSWTVSLDGSGNVTAAMTLSATGVVAGTYSVLTVDAKGRVSAGRALQASDVPTLNQSTTGNAATATKWAAARSVTMSGDGSWTVNLDGSGNVSAAMTLATTGVVAGTYPKVTVDAKGRVTAGAALTAADIPGLDTSKLISGSLPVSRGGTGGTDQATARAGLGIGSMATRNVTISTAAPSGGADGDVWFQY